MKLGRKIKRLFSRRRDLVPIIAQQGDLLCQASRKLAGMLDADKQEWKKYEREIKTLEKQGDAILTEFNEQLPGRLLGYLTRIDLQIVAMSLDDCLDVIKDASKALMIYNPAKIDLQLKELAHLITTEADALLALLPMLADVRRKRTKIILHCNTVTEQEHAADDIYEEYVGYIFANEPDFREMIKYKNLAETFEKATDSEKRVSDNVRTLLLKYAED